MSADGFKDQVVLVTGGSRGIGRAAAALFGQAGATVAITYKSRKPEADALVEELSHQGREAMAVQADFADSAAPGIAVEAAVKRWGRLDVLVNNAGLTRDTLVMRMSEADWDIVIQTNLRAAFLASKAALRPMLKQKYGRIVNVSSLAGVVGNAGQANYSASKAGLIGLTKALAKEVRSRNITVNAVRPGFIAEQLGVEPEQVTPDASFVEDLNADSLDLVELIMAFEEEYGMEIPDEDAEKIQTVGAAWDYVQEKLGITT